MEYRRAEVEAAVRNEQLRSTRALQGLRETVNKLHAQLNRTRARVEAAENDVVTNTSLVNSTQVAASHAEERLTVERQVGALGGGIIVAALCLPFMLFVSPGDGWIGCGRLPTAAE
jgi:hypothetical protein